MTKVTPNGPDARPLAQLKRFRALEDILMGFSDGVDGDRLQAGLIWAKTGRADWQRQDDDRPLRRPVGRGAGRGGLVKAVLDEHSSDVRKEAVQTAAMAARVVLDGDASVNDWRAAKGLDPLTGGAAAALTPGTTLRHRDGRTGTFVSVEEDGRYRVRALNSLLKKPGFWVFHPADCWLAASELAPPKESEAAHG